MGFFDFLKGPNINAELQNCAAAGGTLLDVRTPPEYQQGHIPGSINLPLQLLGNGQGLPQNKETPLFVYCQSGARSGQAVRLLAQMGYTNVKNIGGMSAYTGKVER